MTEETKKTKVFVYGSLRKGHGNHRLLTESDFKGVYVTLGQYHMVSLGGFPAVFEDKKVGHVTGELYEVDDPTLKRLDALEGNGSFYTRKEIPVFSMEDPLQEETVWIYFLTSMSWRDNITVWNYDQQGNVTSTLARQGRR